MKSPFKKEIAPKTRKDGGKTRSWPSGGTAAWPPADSGLQPSTSAATLLENIQRADAGAGPFPGSSWYRCSGLEPGLAGSIWTGLTWDADVELREKARYNVVIYNVKLSKDDEPNGDVSGDLPFALSSTSLSESLLSSVTANKSHVSLVKTTILHYKKMCRLKFNFLDNHYVNLITSAWACLSVMIDPP